MRPIFDLEVVAAGGVDMRGAEGGDRAAPATAEVWRKLRRETLGLVALLEFGI